MNPKEAKDMIFKASEKWRSLLRCTAIGFMSVHLVLMSACRSSGAMESDIVFLDNYSEAIAQAKTTGKPLFLEFRCAP